MKILNVSFLAILVIFHFCSANQIIDLNHDLKLLVNSREQKKYIFIQYKHILKKYQHLTIKEWLDAYDSVEDIIASPHYSNYFIVELLNALQKGLRLNTSTCRCCYVKDNSNLSLSAISHTGFISEIGRR